MIFGVRFDMRSASEKYLKRIMRLQKYIQGAEKRTSVLLKLVQRVDADVCFIKALEPLCSEISSVSPDHT